MTAAAWVSPSNIPKSQNRSALPVPSNSLKDFSKDVPDFLVMNGDSFLELDLNQLIQLHRTHGGLATMAVVSVENAGRYGTVHVDSANKVTEFCEKTGSDSPGLINAGVYVFSPAILEHIPVGPVSLEKDIFPRLLDQRVYAVKRTGSVHRHRHSGGLCACTGTFRPAATCYRAGNRALTRTREIIVRYLP